MRAGRTRYSNGRGEPELLAALAAKYSQRSGRKVTPENVLVVTGTQPRLRGDDGAGRARRQGADPRPLLRHL